jgi:hypothetical protein
MLDSKGYTLINLNKYEKVIEYFKPLGTDPDYVHTLEYKKIVEEKIAK